MTDGTRKVLKRTIEIVVTILTALLTTLGAHAANIVN